VSVVVRVPGHHELVMKALGAGKDVFCEWPLGASLAEAEAMANLASERQLRTAVGLQARSDPTLMYARELVLQGYIGDVLAVNFTSTNQAVTQRGDGRIWQGNRKNGGNTLTITAGHAIDALCFVLGELEDISARLATTIGEWHNSDTGATLTVDAPDWVSLCGGLERGGEVSFLVATVPSSPDGNRFEIYGSAGTLTITGGTPSGGPNNLAGARGKEPLAAMEVPERFTVVPQGTPAGAPRNVAQAYTRLAAAIHADRPFEPDFAHAVKRHRLIEAVEQSAAEGRSVRLKS